MALRSSRLAAALALKGASLGLNATITLSLTLTHYLCGLKVFTKLRVRKYQRLCNKLALALPAMATGLGERQSQGLVPKRGPGVGDAIALALGLPFPAAA